MFASALTTALMAAILGLVGPAVVSHVQDSGHVPSPALFDQADR